MKKLKPEIIEEIEELVKTQLNNTHMKTNLQQLQEETSQLLPCIDQYCDLNGNTLEVNNYMDEHGEVCQEQVQAQCQYCDTVRFPIIQKITNAYNQGVKDSVEALPEEDTRGATGHINIDAGIYSHNQYREEAINNINKLKQ